MAYYDRYEKFRVDGTVKIVPKLTIDVESTDIYITFDRSRMRFDTLSYRYYNDPDYGWLILQANPSLPSMEYLISDGTTLRIPYPLNSAITRYENAIEAYNVENG